MKTKLIVLLLLCSVNYAWANTPRTDSIAVYALNKTIENLQNITACSFTANTTYDVYSEELGNVQHSQKQEIMLKFPNQFKITSQGDKGHTALIYNGKILTYYSFLKNHYAQMKLSKNILEIIDTINKAHGIDFPAADFFYPDFTNDLLATNTNLIFLGMTEINNKKCFHIAGKNEDMSFQFWIEEGNLFLPVKMNIIYLKDKEMPRFETYYSDWNFNANCNDAMFSFSTPPNVLLINFNSSK